MARRNEHSRDELRDMALAAAEKLLVVQGSRALTTRKIAAEIGYSAGSLYQVFASYDDLCWQINQRTLSMLLKELQVDQNQDPKQALHHYARCYLHFAQQYPQRWLLLFEHQADVDHLMPDSLETLITSLFYCLEQPLTELSLARTEDDLKSGARSLWAAIHGLTALSIHDKLFMSASVDISQMSEQLVERYLVGWQQEMQQ